MTSRETETRAKFVKLANSRVSSAAQKIGLISNLSNRSNYRYEEEDVKKIFAFLRQKLNEAEQRFKKNGSADKDIFKLE